MISKEASSSTSGHYVHYKICFQFTDTFRVYAFITGSYVLSSGNLVAVHIANDELSTLCFGYFLNNGSCLSYCSNSMQTTPAFCYQTPKY